MTLDTSMMNVAIATVAEDVGTDVTGVQTAITLAGAEVFRDLDGVPSPASANPADRPLPLTARGRTVLRATRSGPRRRFAL